MLKEVFTVIMFINSEKELVKIVVLLHIKLRNALKDREKEAQDGLKIILEMMNLVSFRFGRYLSLSG